MSVTAQPAHWPRCDATAAWRALAQHHAQSAKGMDLREAFAQDAQRFEKWSLHAPGVFADLSKNLWDEVTAELLCQLAEQCGLTDRRDQMLRGERINTTEDRAVQHVALREPANDSAQSAAVQQVLTQMLEFAEEVRDTAVSGITDVVNIGIGGSDLGPQMAVAALEPYVHPGLNLHFVSNVDASDITAVLRRLQPQRTLFVIASKTFTTQETMANAQAARRWFDEAGGTQVDRHFVGVTTHVQAAAALGITRTFGFWDWVGGRYSLWSAIGLPIALAVGASHFRSLLAGACAMDGHFAQTPVRHNLPMMLGLLDVWNRNFHHFASRSVAPYHQGLRRLPAYLQQLEMESNGKRVDLNGQPVPFATAPVVWGEPGTNGQHAFFQLLHQGTDVIPVEFIAVRQAWHGLQEHHTKLLANCLAQAQALMVGKTTEQARDETVPTASQTLCRDTLAAHRTFPGNRPSTMLVLEALTPYTLGALIALYEHRVFTSGALWSINSFDQWGVELGKALCNSLLPRFESGDVGQLDASTAGLLRRLRPA